MLVIKVSDEWRLYNQHTHTENGIEPPHSTKPQQQYCQPSVKVRIPWQFKAVNIYGCTQDYLHLRLAVIFNDNCIRRSLIHAMKHRNGVTVLQDYMHFTPGCDIPVHNCNIWHTQTPQITLCREPDHNSRAENRSSRDVWASDARSILGCSAGQTLGLSCFYLRLYRCLNCRGVNSRVVNFWSQLSVSSCDLHTRTVPISRSLSTHVVVVGRFKHAGLYSVYIAVLIKLLC